LKESLKASRRVARIIQKIYIGANKKQHIAFSNFKVQNIVGSYDLKRPINLREVYRCYRKCSMFEPELFPALKFKTCSSKNTMVNIFPNGKLIITGVKEEAEITDTLSYIYRILLKFR
jgi:transcription initiation factor TFIID TATA-box-binding protein